MPEPDVDRIRSICVVGAGTMGSQIAQQCALFGYDVRLTDADVGGLERAAAGNRCWLQRRVDKGEMTLEAMDIALSLVRPSTDLDGAASDSDFVIEAITEQVEAKQEVFERLDQLCPPHVVLASNSSTIGMSQIAARVQRPDRCVNMHFFHPALVMLLVEVMRGPVTSDATVDVTVALARRIGKEPVIVRQEVYGLLVNRILGAIKREAFWLAENGYASPEDIDRAVKLGLRHPMGPFELSDFSGLDVFYYAMLQRYRETGDESDRPPRLLEEKIKAGHLGRKTGKGFYDYS